MAKRMHLQRSPAVMCLPFCPGVCLQAWRWANELGVRADGRGHGVFSHCARSLQLLSSRHGQHGCVIVLFARVQPCFVLPRTDCAAPIAEVLAMYGSPAQQEQWLKPLLDGSIRFGIHAVALRVCAAVLTSGASAGLALR
jgi:hypothetical protein